MRAGVKAPPPPLAHLMSLPFDGGRMPLKRHPANQVLIGSQQEPLTFNFMVATMGRLTVLLAQ
jgi:hypothetical protein